MKPNVKAKQALILTMLVFGTVGLFVRGIALPSAEIALYRALLAAITLLIYLRLKKEPLRWHAIKHGLPLLLLSGLAMGLNWILLFEAYRRTTISVATLSYSFAPVLVTLLSPWLFRGIFGAHRTILQFFAAIAALVP